MKKLQKIIAIADIFIWQIKKILNWKKTINYYTINKLKVERLKS